MTCKDSLGHARQPHGVPGRASSFPLPFAPFWSLPWGSPLAGIDADSMPFSLKTMISHLSPPIVTLCNKPSVLPGESSVISMLVLTLSHRTVKRHQSAAFSMIMLNTEANYPLKTPCFYSCICFPVSNMVSAYFRRQLPSQAI